MKKIVIISLILLPLLLILGVMIFTVTVPIEEDKGITAKLPPWEDKLPSWEENGNEKSVYKERNFIKVMVNAENEVTFRDAKIEIKEITDKLTALIKNLDKNPAHPKSVKDAVVSLQNARGADYKVYLEVYNNIKAAYKELWEEKAQELFGKSFSELSRNEITKVRSEVPMNISEAEPTTE